MGAGEISRKSPRLHLLIKSFRMSPLLVWSISLDSTFKIDQSKKEWNIPLMTGPTMCCQNNDKMQKRTEKNVFGVSIWCLAEKELTPEAEGPGVRVVEVEGPHEGPAPRAPLVVEGLQVRQQAVPLLHRPPNTEAKS